MERSFNLWGDLTDHILLKVKSVHLVMCIPGLCSSEYTCARVFISPRNSNFLRNEFFSSEAHSPANVFHEITGTTDALKKNAHDQNEQTINF